MEVFQSVEPCYTWSFLMIYLPFDFQTWLTSNFSLKYPFIIQQPSNENTQTYLVEVVILTYDQILVTNLRGEDLGSYRVQGQLSFVKKHPCNVKFLCFSTIPNFADELEMIWWHCLRLSWKLWWAKTIGNFLHPWLLVVLFCFVFSFFFFFFFYILGCWKQQFLITMFANTDNRSEK